MKNDSKLRQALNGFIDTLNDTDKIEYSISFGKDEKIMDISMREFEANNTKTLIIKINGGARDNLI